MDKTEHLLTCQEEEALELGEVFAELFAELFATVARAGKRSSKALRFGLDEIQPGQGQTNGQRIVAELNDMLGVAELLEEAGVLVGVGDRTAVEAKKEKVRQFMAYAEDCGTLLRSPSNK